MSAHAINPVLRRAQRAAVFVLFYLGLVACDRGERPIPPQTPPQIPQQIPPRPQTLHLKNPESVQRAILFYSARPSQRQDGPSKIHRADHT